MVVFSGFLWFFYGFLWFSMVLPWLLCGFPGFSKVLLEMFFPGDCLAFSRRYCTFLCFCFPNANFSTKIFLFRVLFRLFVSFVFNTHPGL